MSAAAATNASEGLAAELFYGVYVKSATILVKGPHKAARAIGYIDDGSNNCLIRKWGSTWAGCSKILALALGTSLAEEDTPEQLDHFLVNRDAAFDMKFFFECEHVKDLEQEA